jgi:hypothetical protein
MWAGLPAAAMLILTARASAADSFIELTLDCRPVDRHGGVAVERRGLVFADAIDLTKSFDGFVTVRRGGGATITIGPNTGTFTPGSPRATINEKAVVLPGAPFTRNGDLFVPLEAFITRIAGAKVHFNPTRRHADIRVKVVARRER